MPTFKLDGQEIPFEEGDTILHAAWKHGVEIPHYCWHPGLSVAANCRMCLVEIKSERQAMMPVLRRDEKTGEYVPTTKPKLMPACQMPATEGQEVFAKNDAALQAQQHVQEFLLLNHPVDCPICDQAGECKLQDYWLSNQGTLKRKYTEPVHKPKGVRFGPTIVYDAERCIMCTRCIRVCDELVGDHVLDMRERGNKNEIVLSPGRELDHQYTLMTEHVCPVGALTSRDFRFKARVWFLRAVPSVCTGCATGCSSFIDYDPRDNRVYRLRPRDNMAVNKFWMCDDGMMTYKQIHEHRVTTGSLKNGEHMATLPEHALQTAADTLAKRDGSKVAVVLSAQHCSEDNYALVQLAREVFGTSKLYLAALGGWQGDDILRHSDNNPNRAGALRVAGTDTLPGLDALLADAENGEIEGVVALGWGDAHRAEQLTPLAKQGPVVSLTTHEGPLPDVASIVIPVTTHAEMHGTFVNYQGLEQRFKPAIKPQDGVKPAWQVAVDLAVALRKPLPFKKLLDIRNALKSQAPTQSSQESSTEAQT